RAFISLYNQQIQYYKSQNPPNQAKIQQLQQLIDQLNQFMGTLSCWSAVRPSGGAARQTIDRENDANVNRDPQDDRLKRACTNAGRKRRTLWPLSLTPLRRAATAFPNRHPASATSPGGLRAARPT